MALVARHGDDRTGAPVELVGQVEQQRTPALAIQRGGAGKRHRCGAFSAAVSASE